MAKIQFILMKPNDNIVTTTLSKQNFYRPLCGSIIDICLENYPKEKKKKKKTSPTQYIKKFTYSKTHTRLTRQLLLHESSRCRMCMNRIAGRIKYGEISLGSSDQSERRVSKRRRKRENETNSLRMPANCSSNLSNRTRSIMEKWDTK